MNTVLEIAYIFGLTLIGAGFCAALLWLLWDIIGGD